MFMCKTEQATVALLGLFSSVFIMMITDCDVYCHHDLCCVGTQSVDHLKAVEQQKFSENCRNHFIIC